MAAVTFTRKAASELRGRFHLALERAHAVDHQLNGYSDVDQTGESGACTAALSSLRLGSAGTRCAHALGSGPDAILFLRRASQERRRCTPIPHEFLCLNRNEASVRRQPAN
jgi:hypothetical protein